MLASSRRPCAAAMSAGGPWPSPTNHGKRAANRDGPAHPGGRRAGCPHPAAPCAAATPAGGYGIRPYNQRRARGQPGNRCPCVIKNLCRGRCSHRPGGTYAARTPAGGINPAPTNKFAFWTNRDGPAHPGGRRAGCPHPAAPLRRREPPRADMESAPTTNGGHAANRETAVLAL